MAERIIVAYVPVLHAGYERFFDNYPDAEIYVLGEEITDQFKPLAKDIRALGAAKTVKIIQALYPGRHVRTTGSLGIVHLAADASIQQIIMPNEEVCRQISGDLLPGDQRVVFDDIWLRWDATSSTAKKDVGSHDVISTAELDRAMFDETKRLAQLSGDWYRRLGAVLVTVDGHVFTAYNRHLPSEQQPYIDGDPRANFSRGEHIDLSTALHAETSVVTQAARAGVSTEGGRLWVDAFPCPPCAKVVGSAGVDTLYFATGYSVLDGERVLRHFGVKLIRVEMQTP